jgi:hypothetical protein
MREAIGPNFVGVTEENTVGIAGLQYFPHTKQAC